MDISGTFDDKAKSVSLDDALPKDIQALFDKISHLTISDSETDEGLREVIVAFKEFLTKQECWNAIENFEELLKEKGKETGNEYRNNKRTPNVLHEIRNCMHSLSMIKAGAYDMEAYNKEGGIDADMVGRLRHDSIEDKGQFKSTLLNMMHRNLQKMYRSATISYETYKAKFNEAGQGAEIVERLSAKEAKVNPKTGKIIWKDKKSLKPEKVARFGGDINKYFYYLRESPLALLAKYADRNENISSRVGQSGFTVSKDRKYVRQTLETFYLENFRDKSIEMHPGFEKAIRASDAMLGLQTHMLSGMNKYRSNEKNDPYYGDEFDLEKFLPEALELYQHLPTSMHPVSIAIDNMRIEAGKDARLHAVIDRLILPPLKRAIEENNLKPISGVDNGLHFPGISNYPSMQLRAS